MDYEIGHKILCHLKEVDNLVEGKYQPFVSCEIDTSNRCQLNCKWCFFRKYRKENQVDLDPSIYRRVILSLYNEGCGSITFTGGGEPLLHPLIKGMIEFAYIHNMKLGLVTNGVNLHKIVKDLHRFSFIRVSLDCANKEHYHFLKGADYFDQVCDNILMAVAVSNCDVGVSMVHIPKVNDRVADFTKLGKKLGVDYIQVKASWQPAGIEKQTPAMQNPEAFVTPRHTVKNHLPCTIAGLCGNLAANGKFYYCCNHRGNPQFEMWDMNHLGDFRSIFNFRKEMKPDISKCGSCRYANFAKIYKQVIDKKYTMLRHRDFV